MVSRIEGLVATDRRLMSSVQAYRAIIGAILETEARKVQAHVLADVPVASGATREVLASPEALKIERDRDGNVSGFTFGFLTVEGRKRAFYFVWIETGREAGTKNGRRRAGRTRAGAIRYRKITRTVGSIQPRRIFARAAVALSDRMIVQRGLAQAVKALGQKADKP